MNVSPYLIGFLEGYLAGMSLRDDIPKDLVEKSKRLADTVKNTVKEIE